MAPTLDDECNAAWAEVNRLRAEVTKLVIENDRLRRWINTEARNCPSHATVDAALHCSQEPQRTEPNKEGK